jgi:metallo-beta-lactamase family protein
VTGSKYLLEADGERILVDCGMFQGLKELRQRNWMTLPFDAQSVTAVVLTHAHIDHTGYLPRLVKQGFRGPIHGTPATVELTELLLLDSAHNQEDDAAYANRKGFSKHQPALPLFDQNDVQQTIKQLRPAPRDAWFSPAAPFRARYREVGHLLGASMIEMEIGPPARPLRVLFSGDVGRYGAPIYHDPTPPPACDYLICESTYGSRDHPTVNVLDQLCEVTQAAIRRGGAMVVASFAVGRAQQLIYLLQHLIHQKRIPDLPIYLDSPMAVNATEIYAAHLADHALEEGDLLDPAPALFGRNVHLTRTANESKRINGVQGPVVIIASSGMMIGGRILHHLKQRLPDTRNTIVLGGFMAEGSRGRQLQEGRRALRIHGQDIPVRAAVAEMSALSGHAGRSELLRWLENLSAPRRTFLTHGEKQSAYDLAAALRASHGWEVAVPRMGESFELEAPR